MRLGIDVVESPIGPVSLSSDGAALFALEFGRPEERLLARLLARFGPDLAAAPAVDPGGFTRLVRAYFAGDLRALEGGPVEGGGTPFQRRVWAELRRIPAGSTTTYAALAARLGRPGASRAVGLANGRNPIAIAVPCHRVIGSDGTLTGYAGGIERKRWLLAHEGVIAPAAASGGFRRKTAVDRPARLRVP